MNSTTKYYREGLREQPFSNLEIHPCRIEEKGGDEYIVRCEEGKQDFYSLYAIYKMPNGHFESSCIADIPEKENAKDLMYLIVSTSLTRNRKT